MENSNSKLNLKATDFLADTFDLDSFRISKPKKYRTDLMVAKVKNKNKEPIIVQFPKMTISDYTKFVELGFLSKTGYSKKVHDFLSNLDEKLINYIASHSEDWFGKQIPLTSVTQMYNKFIKVNENGDFINFVFDKKSELINKKNEILHDSELVKGETLECISQLKYIVFTKENCFMTWEICTAKLHKKYNFVPKFGFIEDQLDESDDELDDEKFTFF